MCLASSKEFGAKMERRQVNACASIRGLKVSFGGHTALNGVDVDFSEGCINVLLGRSGSGKTTLLRSLNRLNECFDGYRGEGELTVVLDGITHSLMGRSSLPLSVLRRSVGMVFQTPNPLPLSIRKNMTVPLTLVAGKRKDEAEAAMESALTEVGLWEEVRDRLDRSAVELSGGQQQRLCLARALVLEPKILLLDEPTASLDRPAASRIEELIHSFRKRYSIIMVSHSLSQARRVGDFLIVMAEGRVGQKLPASALPRDEAERLLEALL